MVTFPAKTLAQLITSDSEIVGAPFTAKSKATGKEYTFKVSSSSFKEKLYIHVYVETQYLDFKHLGTYRSGKLWKAGKVVESPSAVAITWILNNSLHNLPKVTQQVELLHIGKCLKCGRPLTDSSSIESGLGPVCRTK